jgi:hypothetical protein
MLRDWEKGLVGNNPGTTARLPRRMRAGRVLINAVRGRFAPRGARTELPSAA